MSLLLAWIVSLLALRLVSLHWPWKTELESVADHGVIGLTKSFSFVVGFIRHDKNQCCMLSCHVLKQCFASSLVLCLFARFRVSRADLERLRLPSLCSLDLSGADLERLHLPSLCSLI